MTSTKSNTTSRQGVRRAAVAIIAVALLATPALAEDPPEPQKIVRETIDQVLEVLAHKDLGTDERIRRIEEIAYGRFDFATISRLVLARSWKQFTPEQREEFVEQFKIQLSRSYGTRITRYEQEQVAILGSRAEPRGDVTVATRIEGGTADGILVDYRLRKGDGPWMLIDVIIEGVSLVSSYRSQFAEILGHGDPEELLKQLREKNAASAASSEASGARSEA